MIVSYNDIISAIQLKKVAPVYVLDGDEPFYFDKLIQLFEQSLLSEQEKEFNQTILYGREVQWAEVINACRRFPMFAEKQVVILKDAASMNGFNELVPYFKQPSPTTILIIEYRNKKIDGKTTAAKIIKEHCAYFTSEKIKDDAMPKWIINFGKDIGFEIQEREAHLLNLYLGNNLQKIANEIEKIRINVPNEKTLDGNLIQKYIGISREYNVFDFPEAFSSGNKEKAYRMIAYFIANPKNAPMVLLTTSLYTHFLQIYKANFAVRLPEKDRAGAIGISPYFVKQIMGKVNFWNLKKTEDALMTIARYNTYSLGIDSSESDSELFKEMMGKLELIYEGVSTS